MKGLFLAVDENQIILQAHPLLRRYIKINNVVGQKLDLLFGDFKEFSQFMSVIKEMDANNTSESKITISLNQFDVELTHISFDKNLSIRVLKSGEEDFVYLFIAQDINEMEQYYNLFREKENLFSHSINVLKDISKTVVSEPSSKVAARKSIEMVCDLLRAESAIIRLKNKRLLEKYVTYNISGDYLGNNLEIDPRGVPIYNAVLTTRKIIIDENPEVGLGRLYPEMKESFDIKVLVVLPIISYDKIVGVLSLFFSEADVNLLKECEDILENVGNELNFMLEKGDYFLELLDTTEQLRSLNINIVTALSDAIETRDPYTKGHSERVATYAVEIARNMGWDDYELDRLRTAGILHDIGKVGIPDAVLLKPGALSKHEYEIMKLHPEMSAAIVSEIESFTELIPWVRYHHENFDGTGYPYGLKGNDITLGARVIAVADAFDAMTSDRPYRKGLPIDRVKEIFQEGAGSQWDPEIVDIALDSLEIIFEKTPLYFHIPEMLDEFRQRVFNMNLMDGLYLYEYVYDETVKNIEQKKPFSISVISLKNALQSFNSIDQKRTIALLIDIIKKDIHYPLLVTRYNYYDLIILAPLTDPQFMRKIINKIMVEFFQQTKLFYAVNILNYPNDVDDIDKLLHRLHTEIKDVSMMN